MSTLTAMVCHRGQDTPQAPGTGEERGLDAGTKTLRAACGQVTAMTLLECEGRRWHCGAGAGAGGATVYGRSASGVTVLGRVARYCRPQRSAAA